MGLGCGKACGILLLRAAGLLAERSSAKRRRFVPSCQRGDGEVAVRGAGVPQTEQGWRGPSALGLAVRAWVRLQASEDGSALESNRDVWSRKPGSSVRRLSIPSRSGCSG